MIATFDAAIIDATHITSKKAKMTDQDYESINEATVGGGPSNIGTYAKAPPVTVNLYDEASPTLYSECVL